MEKDRNYRHELKFEIPYGEYVAMQKRLEASVTKTRPPLNQPRFLRYNINIE